MGKSPYGIDVSTISSIAKEVKKVYESGYQVCIIIGGGNIFRGIKGASEGIDRSTSDYMGMLATVMNALSFQTKDAAEGIRAFIEKRDPAFTDE